MNEKENDILRSASALAASASTWADLSNALFNPVNGLITKAYPTRESRTAFLKTDEYRQIRQLVSSVMDRTGLATGATPRASGGS